MHDDSVIRTLAAAARDLARLIVPVECPGCGALDVVCCPRCAALVDGPLRRREEGAPRLHRYDGVGPLPVWAPAEYVGPLRDLVVAWKDRGRADLDPVLGGGLRRVGSDLRATFHALGAGRLLVVPAPSSRAALADRGRDVVAGLARSLAAGLAPVPTGVVAALAARRRTADQVGLGSRARGRRLGSVRVVPRARAVVRGRPCLLVDDVLTTGATLAACEDALAGAGAHVVGAVVLAATPPPGGRSGDRLAGP